MVQVINNDHYLQRVGLVTADTIAVIIRRSISSRRTGRICGVRKSIKIYTTGDQTDGIIYRMYHEYATGITGGRTFVEKRKYLTETYCGGGEVVTGSG